MRELSQHSARLIAKSKTKAIKKASLSDFARGIRSAVYGYWSGKTTRFDFIDSMLLAIESGYRNAWRDGAAECGIEMEELSQHERDALMSEMWKETGYVFGFADDIEAGSKANGGKLGVLHKRAELWINRYKSVYNQAQLMACEDRKFIWRLGATEKHCRSCSRLNGKVKRQSTWIASGVRPQNPPNPLLECQGWRCDCLLEVTDLPLSRGKLPALP